MTEDHRFFYLGDELDELRTQFSGTRTMIFDITDLDDPVLVKEHFGESTASDHNMYVLDDLLYQSNYNSGLRILDVSDPENPTEVGFLDTVPYAEGTVDGRLVEQLPVLRERDDHRDERERGPVHGQVPEAGTRTVMKRIASTVRSGLLALGMAGLVAVRAAAAPVTAPSTEGPFLYVANQEAAAVTVIDLETHAVVEVIDLEAMGYGANAKPHHVAVEPDGSFWYVSLIAANRVLKFDRDNELVASVEFERPGLLALHPSEPWLFVGRSMAAVNPPQRIGRIDRMSMEVEE